MHKSCSNFKINHFVSSEKLYVDKYFSVNPSLWYKYTEKTIKHIITPNREMVFFNLMCYAWTHLFVEWVKLKLTNNSENPRKTTFTKIVLLFLSECRPKTWQQHSCKWHKKCFTVNVSPSPALESGQGNGLLSPITRDERVHRYPTVEPTKSSLNWKWNPTLLI